MNIKDDCFFTIIICAYNEENHLSKSVDSILKQTFENFEVIIVISTEQTPISNCGKATLIFPPSTSQSSSD